MLDTKSYSEQAERWPKAGRHLLAHYDDESVVAYQAYRLSVARYAVENGRLGGDEFSYARMSWIKPNFLWMMYRSGWGTKPDQEATLGLRLRRPFFESLLAQAVASTWDPERFPSRGEWQEAVARSNVRLQWDPDHDPFGAKLERRALQLGLRGEALEALGRREIREVLDLTEFVAAQRSCLSPPSGLSALRTPTERVYVPTDPTLSGSLGLSAERTA